MADPVTSSDPAATADVLTRLDALEDELVDAISKAVQINSVNPKYPGQVYDTVVGGEGEVSRFMAEIYRGIGAEVDLWAEEPGRENAVATIKGAGGRSLIYNGHVDVVPDGDPAIATPDGRGHATLVIHHLLADDGLEDEVADGSTAAGSGAAERPT